MSGLGVFEIVFTFLLIVTGAFLLIMSRAAAKWNDTTGPDWVRGFFKSSPDATTPPWRIQAAGAITLACGVILAATLLMNGV